MMMFNFKSESNPTRMHPKSAGAVHGEPAIQRCHRQMRLCVAACLALLTLTMASSTRSETLQVCVSTPDIQSITQAIGGDLVSVTSFSQGSQDPHQIQIRPSMARSLKKADLVIWIGQGLESAWKDRLIKQAGADHLAGDSTAALDLGQFVNPPEEVEDDDEEEGEEEGFHEEGNPHYMLDPWEGLQAARRITLKLIELAPAAESDLKTAFATWATEWKSLCFGAPSTAADWNRFLDSTDEERTALLKNWTDKIKTPQDGLFAKMKSVQSTPLVGDHDLWGYLARRFELNVIGYIEAHPGAAPTTRHLTGLVKEMKESNAKLILQSPYFSKRYVQFVQRATQAKAIPLAHQTQATPDASTYLKMLESNINRLVEAALAAK